MKRYIFTTALVLILVILFCVFNSEEKLPTSLDPNRSIWPEADYGINIQTENNDFAGVITVNEIKHPMGSMTMSILMSLSHIVLLSKCCLGNIQMIQ